MRNVPTSKNTATCEKKRPDSGPARIPALPMLAILLVGLLAFQGCDSDMINCGGGIPPDDGGRFPSDGGGGGNLTGETSPGAAVSRLESYLGRSDFEALFPVRFGSPGWIEHTGRTDVIEYHSFDNLKAAVWEMAHLKYEIEFRDHPDGLMPYLSRSFVTNKATGTRAPVVENPGFNAEWNQGWPIVTQTVDFGSFLAAGSANDRRRELAAFLANISHETTGGWDGAPGGRFAWGLFFNEEVGFESGDVLGYVQADPNFPPCPGRSYHGRGPIQLSWNFNYGLASAVLFQDRSILLRNPERVAACGKLGFMTALWFWMTPQAPKPSCHDIMTGNWTPTPADIADGRTEPGFGMTIMVLDEMGAKIVDSIK